jgi:hypothetical protein
VFKMDNSQQSTAVVAREAAKPAVKHALPAPGAKKHAASGKTKALPDKDESHKGTPVAKPKTTKEGEEWEEF